MKWQKSIRNTNKWRKKSIEIKERDNYFCQFCYFIKGTKYINDILEVHHIKSITNYPELTYSNNNLITLCKSCHRLIENNNKNIYDDNGNSLNTSTILEELAKKNESR